MLYRSDWRYVCLCLKPFIQVRAAVGWGELSYNVLTKCAKLSPSEVGREVLKRPQLTCLSIEMLLEAKVPWNCQLVTCHIQNMDSSLSEAYVIFVTSYGQGLMPRLTTFSVSQREGLSIGVYCIFWSHFSLIVLHTTLTIHRVINTVLATIVPVCFCV